MPLLDLSRRALEPCLLASLHAELSSTFGLTLKSSGLHIPLVEN